MCAIKDMSLINSSSKADSKIIIREKSENCFNEYLYFWSFSNINKTNIQNLQRALSQCHGFLLQRMLSRGPNWFSSRSSFSLLYLLSPCSWAGHASPLIGGTVQSGRVDVFTMGQLTISSAGYSQKRELFVKKKDGSLWPCID